MAVKKDESSFVKAYKDEGIEFKSFQESQRRQDRAENSSFSLMRGLAQSKEEASEHGVLGSSLPPLRDRGSIMNLVHGKTSASSAPNSLPEARINLVDVARPLRNRSSIHAFLSQNVPEEDMSFDTNPYLQNHDSTVAPIPPSSGAQTTSQKRYSSLFKSSGNSEFNQNKNSDSLQDIYKRLLECQ